MHEKGKALQKAWKISQARASHDHCVRPAFAVYHGTRADAALSDQTLGGRRPSKPGQYASIIYCAWPDRRSSGALCHLGLPGLSDARGGQQDRCRDPKGRLRKGAISAHALL